MASGCYADRGAVGWISIHLNLEIIMGKYLVDWILGVPAIVLLVVYFFFR
jgi:hypothetical protein